jgi:hypothetical protein
LRLSCSSKLTRGIARRTGQKPVRFFIASGFGAGLFLCRAGVVLGIVFRIDLRHFLVGLEAHQSRAIQCLLKIHKAIAPDMFASFKGEERAAQFHYASIVIVYDVVALQSTVGALALSLNLPE